MNYLIDTHALIWFAEPSTKLPLRVRQLIENPANNLVVSMAAIWEMTIKVSLAKLTVTFTLPQWESFLIQNQFIILNSTFHHFEVLQQLPFHHNDPFDRIMIAQGIADNLTIITHDDKFLPYPVKLEHF